MSTPCETALRSTYYADGTVRYWSVYHQVWQRVPFDMVPDREIATWSESERVTIMRHTRLGKVG